MRLLHVVPTYIPAYRYGGPIYSVHSICRSLVERGHGVDVYTTNVDGTRNTKVPLGTPVDLDGVQVWYFSCPYARRLYYSPTMMGALDEHAKDYDLIHLHSVYLWPTWAAARMARQQNVPYLLSPRGMLVKELVRRKSRWKKSFWLHVIERKNIEHASALHVTSETEAAALEDFGFELPAVFKIPNGIDSPQPYRSDDLSADVKGLLQQSSYVLYLGRLNWKKGLDRLIKAWRDMNGIRLVIAGNDEEDYLSELQALVDSLGLVGRITFVPRSIGGADKEALYSGARLFVLPSYSESFGNTVLEAMIRSVPVVVTPDVGASEVVKSSKSGVVVDGDPATMAVAIRELLSDESEMARMGNAGRVEAETNCSWSKVGESMDQLYGSIVERAG